MALPKKAEIWKLKDGKTVRVEYFMTTQYLCTIVDRTEHGGQRCIAPFEFENRVGSEDQKSRFK